MEEELLQKKMRGVAKFSDEWNVLKGKYDQLQVPEFYAKWPERARTSQIESFAAKLGAVWMERKVLIEEACMAAGPILLEIESKVKVSGQFMHLS